MRKNDGLNQNMFAEQLMTLSLLSLVMIGSLIFLIIMSVGWVKSLIVTGSS